MHPISRTAPVVVGIVGGGQLAAMMVQASDLAHVECIVLARPGDESAQELGAHILLSEVIDAESMTELAQHCDVVTFDFEPTDLAAVESVEATGAVVSPSSNVFSFTDKAIQRERFASAGIAVPGFSIVSSLQEVCNFAERYGWPVVAKLPTGGYDGRGVFVLETAQDAESLLGSLSSATTSVHIVVEEFLDLTAEAAGLIVRGHDESKMYPLVDTRQQDGICVEVTTPTRLSHAIQQSCRDTIAAVDQVVGGRGVLAVELFIVGDRVLVNEVAPRPHNSGHITIDAHVTSQFENHLRAVSGQALRDASQKVPAAAMVNVLGPDDDHPINWQAPLPVGALAHRYGKSQRPGRKVGHVTACADTIEHAVDLAQRAVATLTGAPTS